MKKIVVLNSGGFDSTVLLADLAMSGNDYEIHSLYFNYGQLNSDIDSVIAKENAERLGAIHHYVSLPTFSWSNSEFYSEDSNDYSTQYLEMRNMVFISYAMSLADSICATSIYMAILSNGNYKDTSRKFIGAVKNLCSTVDVSFETPFSENSKEELFVLAKSLGVGTKLPFISCDTPVDGKPCGKCSDCLSLKSYDDILTDDIPIKRFFTANMNTHDYEFQRLFMQNPISEIRVLLNNDCQLCCKHCYHKDNSLLGDILTDDELISVLVDAYNLGIRSVHYAGKEPLFNERIFTITNRLRFEHNVPDLEFSVVTNGINVPKYAGKIKESGISKVFISSDDEFSNENGIRPDNINTVVKNAVIALNNLGVPVEIFYDLTPDNIGHTVDNIRFWRKRYKVKYFHIRTIRRLGNAEDFNLIPIKDICDLHYELKHCNVDARINLNVGACPYAYDILFSNEDFVDEIMFDIMCTGRTGSERVTKNYNLLFESYCGRYESQITLTADGYLLGCAMECSVKDYNNTSSGNVRDKSLKELIDAGKRQSIEVNELQMTDNIVNFQKCVFNPIDF